MVPDKKELMLHLMEDAWVFVYLDPRREGVNLPAHLLSEKHLILQYGYNMPVPIADLAVDERGISATLSFRRISHMTFIPWSAVFAMTDGDKRSYVWQDDLPADLVLSAQGQEGQTGTKEAPAATLPAQSEQPEQSASQKAPPGKKPRPSYLKLVN